MPENESTDSQEALQQPNDECRMAEFRLVGCRLAKNRMVGNRWAQELFGCLCRLVEYRMTQCIISAIF